MPERPAVPDSDELRFQAELRTRWSDEDNHGVLNNAVYLTLLEEARHAYFSSLGLLEGGGFPFVLAACNAAFLAPGAGARDVVVEMATTHLGKSSFTQAYRVGDAEAGVAWLEAEAVLVCVDDEGRSRAIPAAFREAVEAFEAGRGAPR